MKTLREIEWEYSKKAYDYNIKEEAIKWIKEDIETFKEFYKNTPVFVLKWMYRLNITEEEFKSNEEKEK